MLLLLFINHCLCLTSLLQRKAPEHHLGPSWPDYNPASGVCYLKPHQYQSKEMIISSNDEASNCINLYLCFICKDLTKLVLQQHLEIQWWSVFTHFITVFLNTGYYAHKDNIHAFSKVNSEIYISVPGGNYVFIGCKQWNSLRYKMWQNRHYNREYLDTSVKSMQQVTQKLIYSNEN